jgi:3-oxoacyl-ACP reductase-like protein
MVTKKNIHKALKLQRLISHMGEEWNVYRVLMGKPEVKRPLGRSRRRWEDEIRMDVREIGCGSVDWIQLAQDWDRGGIL